MNLLNQVQNEKLPPVQETVSTQILPSIAPEDNPVLIRALELIRAGIGIIPVNSDRESPNFKKPLIPAWKKYQPYDENGSLVGRLPSETEAIEWFTRFPNANIAVIGGWKGITCIDIDRDERLMSGVVQKMINTTILEKTVNGGLHILVRTKQLAGCGKLPNNLGDIKGNGGYFIVSPSIGYEAINPDVGIMEVEDIDSFVESIIPSTTNRPEQEYGVKPYLVPMGQRNNELTSLAGWLRRRGRTPEQIWRHLQLARDNELEIVPNNPVTDQELVNISKSVGRYPIGEPSTSSNLIPISLEEVEKRKFNGHVLQNIPEDEIGNIEYYPIFGRDGFIAMRWAHILAGFGKVGKTEALISAMEEWRYLGANILYLSEESKDIWIQRLRKKQGDYSHLNILVSLGISQTDLLHIVRNSEENVIVVDTVRNLLRVEEENNNSQVVQALVPFIEAARESDKTIIFIHHTRKSGGKHGHAIAGAHAFLGAVDIALELDFDSHSPEGNKRVLKGYGRINQVPELLYELNQNDEFIALGDPSSVGFDNIKERVLTVLTDEWQITGEIHDALDEDTRPSKEYVRQVLTFLAEAGEAQRDPSIADGKLQGKTPKWRLMPDEYRWGDK